MLTPSVVPEELIESAWGNEIRDRTLQVFQSGAELHAAWPDAPDGANAILLDSGRIARRILGQWVHTEPRYGVHTDSMNAIADTGTLSYGVAYLNTAPILVGSVQVGSNADLVLQWQTAPQSGGVGYRVATRGGGVYNGGYAIHWSAKGTWLVPSTAVADIEYGGPFDHTDPNFATGTVDDPGYHDAA